MRFSRRSHSRRRWIRHAFLRPERAMTSAEGPTISLPGGSSPNRLSPPFAVNMYDTHERNSQQDAWSRQDEPSSTPGNDPDAVIVASPVRSNDNDDDAESSSAEFYESLLNEGTSGGASAPDEFLPRNATRRVLSLSTYNAWKKQSFEQQAKRRKGILGGTDSWKSYRCGVNVVDDDGDNQDEDRAFDEGTTPCPICLEPFWKRTGRYPIYDKVMTFLSNLSCGGFLECPQIWRSSTATPLHLPCGHLFHEPCIKVWLTRNRSTCPLCLKEVLPEYDNTVWYRSHRRIRYSLIDILSRVLINDEGNYDIYGTA